MAKCFVIMPISMLDTYADRYNDPEHFKHVLDHLFIPALEAAGYETVPPTITGSDLIQAEIISNLETCDLVLCDISTLNPNVFFELGIRTSLDRPVAMVRDNFTIQIPFDTGSINTHTYDASLRPWALPSEAAALTLHIQQVTARSVDRNALWRYFGLTRRASPAEISNPIEAKLDLLIDEVTRLAKPNLPPSTSGTGLRVDSAFRYEVTMMEVLTSLGYSVRPASRDIGFDLIVKNGSGQRIYAELAYSSKSISVQRVSSIILKAAEARVPVLLITNSELSGVTLEATYVPENLEVIQWRDENDDDRLAETLRDMFAAFPSSPGTATNDQSQ